MALEAVFLDRDGTINVKAPRGAYISSSELVRLLPGAAAAIAKLNARRIPVIVVTNQRGIAQGKMTLGDLDAVHARLDALLDAEGAYVDRYYYCPHGSGACGCRKPRTGLFKRAVQDLRLSSFARTVTIGDQSSDVQAGRRVGSYTVRLRARNTAPQDFESADFTASSLYEAVDWVLARESGYGSVKGD